MSVNTTAKEKINEFRDHLKGAVESLSSVLVDDCWGVDELSDKYKEQLRKAFVQLLEMKSKFQQ